MEQECASFGVGPSHDVPCSQRALAVDVPWIVNACISLSGSYKIKQKVGWACEQMWFVTCMRTWTRFQAVGWSVRLDLPPKLAFLHQTLLSDLLSANPPDIYITSTIGPKNSITLVEWGWSVSTYSQSLPPAMSNLWKNRKKMHLKFLLHTSIPAAILRVPIQPRQLAPEQTMRAFLFYWNIDWKYCWPNLDIGDCNAKAFTPNFDPLCQQGQVVIEEVVKPNLKQNIINRHQIRWWWWWWWGVCHVFAYFIFSLF